jgi:hypothetical protein
MRSLPPVFAFAVAAAFVVTTLAPVSSLADGGRVVRRGDCSGPSVWRLEVRKGDAGRLRVRLEVEGGRSGQKWHAFLSDNGLGFFAGSRISGSDGHFRVERRTRNQAGSDAIRAGANNITTGESCNGRATL